MGIQSVTIVLVLRRMHPRLAAAVQALLTAADTVCADTELILVTCSDDQALAEAADRLAIRHPSVMVLHHRASIGYAFALQDAWSVARGELILAIDEIGETAAQALPRLYAAMEQHAVALAYRPTPPRSLRNELRVRMARRKLGFALHDPALRLAMFRSELAHSFPAQANNELVHGQLYAAAAAAGLSTLQLALSGTPTASETAPAGSGLRTPPAPSPRQATLGGLMMALLGGIWLLRRWFPGPRDEN